MTLQRKAILTAFLLGTVPAFIININYLLAASEGYVPWCVPYWDSCTSISATGREGSAFYFFKITMIPMALVYLYYWSLVNRILAAAGLRSRVIRRLGVVSAVALLGYTLALGAVGDGFQLTRRIGIIFYFTLTYLNQLLVVYQIYQRKLPDRTRLVQASLCAIILFIGLTTLVLDILLSNYDDFEDAFEWNLALLIHINFFIAAFGWRSMTQVEN